MANIKNLKKYGKDKPPLTHEEAVKIGKSGGEKSGVKRREIKSFREYAEKALSTITKDNNGNELNYKAGIVLRLVKRALSGDIRAVELLMKLIGEMPSDKTEITGKDGGVISVEHSFDIEKIKKLKDLIGV